MVVSGGRVRNANQAARTILGSDIQGQDVRHPTVDRR